MTLTQKITRVAAATTAEDILESDPKTVASGEKEKQDDKNLQSKHCDKTIAEWIGQPFKPPLRNEDEEDEDKEEDFGDPLASIEDVSPVDKYDEGCEDDW